MLVALLPSFGPVELLVIPLFGLLVIWPACRICSRAGFPWQLGLLVMLPGLNLVLLFVLAFVEWPALRRGGK